MNAEVAHWQTILEIRSGERPSVEEVVEFLRQLEDWYAGIQPGVIGVKHE